MNENEQVKELLFITSEITLHYLKEKKGSLSDEEKEIGGTLTEVLKTPYIMDRPMRVLDSMDDDTTSKVLRRIVVYSRLNPSLDEEIENELKGKIAMYYENIRETKYREENFATLGYYCHEVSDAVEKLRFFQKCKRVYAELELTDLHQLDEM